MDPVPIIRTLVEQVGSAPLALHLAALPAPRYRPFNGAEIIDALRYLRDTLRSCGWQVIEQPCYHKELGAGTNLLATLPGVTSPQALVVVGAHHDTVRGSPGADDNGSGLAGLLELGRLLGGRRWEATIQLVAFDFGEAGQIGSKTYIEALRSSPVELRGAFILEAIGYSARTPGSQLIPPELEQLYPEVVSSLAQQGMRGNFILALGSAHQAAFVDCFAEWAMVGTPDLPLVALQVPLDAPLKRLFRSDHASFWDAGLPAIMLTDTAHFRNPHYHQPSDTPGTLDPAFWRRVVMATLAAVAALATPL